MLIADIAAVIESIAPLSLQESYDNAGLLCGDLSRECSGVLCTLDVTEEVVQEAVRSNCNCIVAHHPIIFRGIKDLTVRGHVQRALIIAIKHDVSIYAAHTNMDNVLTGVNGMIAKKLALSDVQVLEPRGNTLKKLFTFVPESHFSQVREAIFKAGGGNISNYSECSFSHRGTGTFTPGEGTSPFSGEIGKREEANELKLEVILPAFRETAVLDAMREAHPYEEVAYDVVTLDNIHQETGSGAVGNIAEVDELKFIEKLRSTFHALVVRHSPLTGKIIRKVAVCGGSGSFLIRKAIASGAEAFVTADLKYHDFFEAEGKILLCDIGHYESEQFTTELFAAILLQNFPTFAVLKSGVNTNQVQYYTGK